MLWVGGDQIWIDCIHSPTLLSRWPQHHICSNVNMELSFHINTQLDDLWFLFYVLSGGLEFVKHSECGGIIPGIVLRNF